MARESTGPAVRLRGLETNAECRPLGRFVEAVAESAHHAQHADVAGGGEFELERHGAFDAGAARFVGVLRRGLEDDLDRPIDGLRHRCHGRLGGRTRPLIEPRRLHLAACGLTRCARAAAESTGRDGAGFVCGARRGRRTSESAGRDGGCGLARSRGVRPLEEAGLREDAGPLAFRWAVRHRRARAVPGPARPAWRRLARQEAALALPLWRARAPAAAGAAEQEGAASRQGPTAASPGSPAENTIVGRMRGAGGFSGARIVTTIRTTRRWRATRH